MKNIYIVKDKKSFIQSQKPLANIKVLTLKELEDKIFGSYNNEARTYLYLKKNVPFNLVDVYLSSFKYLNGEDLDEKIKYLNSLKQELIDNKLYIFDEIFIHSLKNTKITFYNFIQNKHLDKVIDYLKNKCEVSVSYLDEENINFKVHQYNTLDDEINDVVYRIMSLVNNGVSLNNIKLMNVNKDYYPSLNRILTQYNIPFINLYDCSLESSNYVISFIRNLKKLGVKESIKLLDNEDYDQKILDIINSYAYLDDIELAKEFILKDLKKVKIDKIYKDNYLELVNDSYSIKKDDYIFFLNFNNGNAPTIFEDSDLLTDNEYDMLNELNSTLKTNLKEKELLTILNKCYFISYKLTSLSSKHIPSYLIYKYKIDVIKEKHNSYILNDKIYYSLDFEKFNYALSRDHFYKTREKDNIYDCLAYNFKKYIHNKDYKFTGIDPIKLKTALNSKFTLSYSSLNTYYKCKFQYYLNSILNLNKFENTLPTIRGNVFHKLLEECENPDFNYDEVFENEISKFKETDNKVRFFTSLIKDEFYLVKEFNEELLNSSKLDKILQEYKIEFNEECEGYDIKIKGFIDKIMYDDENIILIDYKTGSTAQFKLDNLFYGLDLQLPMYAYFISKDENLKNKKIAGLYLQYIFKHFNDKKLKDPTLCKREYRLNGYTNSLLQEYVTNDKKTFISKTLLDYPDLVFRNIPSFTEQKLKEGIKGIISGDFKIDPHTINNDKNTDSCSFCPFKDICYFNGKKEDYKSVPYSLFLNEIKDSDILLSCIEDLNNPNLYEKVLKIKVESENEDVLKTSLLKILLEQENLDKKTINLINFINNKNRKEEE